MKEINRIFNILDKNGVVYVVLRNYNKLLLDENISDDEDIDFLCNNKREIINLLKLKKRHKKDTGVHYLYENKGHRIKIDLWGNGDGYICQEWENNILKNREKMNNFFIPDQLNYLFSLMYHILIQKESMPVKYKEEINNLLMNTNNKCEEYTRENMLRLLENFMRSKGYEYTYNSYGLAIVNLEGVDNKLVKKNYYRIIKKSYCFAVQNIKIKILRRMQWEKK